MKIHALEFAGLGPFREKVTLDFEQLSASGLFLLEGSTGAGKSTIIDAIVFALYGSVANSAASKERLRSHFCTDTDPSYVDLFFEVPQGIYRIRRTPLWQRASIRSKSGKSDVNATVKVWKLNSPQALQAAREGSERAEEVTPLTARIDEAARVIPQIVGLSKDQFTQTVVLPQGEFARFLKADTNERKDVLERVFGTEFYRAIEGEFAQARITARQQLDASVSRLRAGFERLLEAAGLSDEERAEATSAAGNFTPQGVQAALAEGEKAQARGSDAEAAAAAALTEATARVQEQEAVKTRLDEQFTLLQRRKDLDEKIARRERERKAATEATKLLNAHAAAEAASYALRERDKGAEQMRTAAQEVDPSIRENPAAWEPALTDAESSHRDYVEKASALASFVAREKEFAAQQKASDAAAATARATGESYEKVASTLEGRPAEREQLRQRREELQEAQEGTDTLLAAVNEWAAKEKAAVRAEAKTEELAKSRIEVGKAREKAHEALTYVTGLRRARIDAMAVELASSLTSGSMCPVCGSLEHPNPASTDAELVSEEQIEAAENTRAKAEETVQACSATFTRIEAELAAALEAADGATPKEAKTRHREAQQAHNAALKARTQLAEVNEELEKFDARSAELQSHASTLKARFEREKAHAEGLAAQVAEVAAQLTEERGEYESVAAKHKALRTRIGEAEKLIAVLRSAVLAHARWVELEQTAAAAISESSFPDEESVRRARLTAATHKAHTATVTAFATLEAQIAEASADPALHEVDASAEREEILTKEREDAVGSLLKARENHTEVASAHAAAKSRVVRTEKAATAFNALASEHRDASAYAANVVNLANLVTGNSADAKARLTLSTFVVMRRFEKVVEAANARLATLGGATYELVLAEPASSGRSRTGLDLEVVDRRTDEKRSPASLSGGETFYVSLALALGLADIVAAESGGTDMSTLFIDEGFGSLDAETLDTVIAEIRHLGTHGRTVGIVSHVAELKTQIAEKIHVRRTSRGTSTIEVVA